MMLEPKLITQQLIEKVCQGKGTPEEGEAVRVYIAQLQACLDTTNTILERPKQPLTLRTVETWW